ncbi:unnamed protein product [Symbiodinium necroappetens]|uniref:Uncharacterized protein n=1 Tax=Symbiodinium necroappetens TaxID=1628268 RepID=A0A812PB30_9DINO|nr:unnamed protein product [Symbiodinium necroappetens]
MQRRAVSASGRVPRAAQVAQQLLKMCPEPARRLLREELRSWKRPSRDALPMLKELRATKRVDLVCELLNLLKAEPSPACCISQRGFPRAPAPPGGLKPSPSSTTCPMLLCCPTSSAAMPP